MSKKKKKRGSGTHGGGSKKKRRGAGSRGGRGKAGEKHKKIKYLKEGGKEEKGFQRPKSAKKEVRTINLKELDSKIDELVERGDANRENDLVEVNLSKLGFNKLLGGGKVTKPLKVKAENFSESAIKKLEESGGKAVELS